MRGCGARLKQWRSGLADALDECSICAYAVLRRESAFWRTVRGSAVSIDDTPSCTFLFVCVLVFGINARALC